MSLGSGIKRLFSRGSNQSERAEQALPAESPRAPEKHAESQLKEQAQAIEIFRAVDEVIAKQLRQALDTAGVTPADQLARNEKYRRALAKYPGLQINPIRAAVEQYAARYDNGSKRLLELLSKELQEHVAQRLRSLALGEPLTHLNVAHLYEAVKKWSNTDRTSNQPALDAPSVRGASDEIKKRRAARTS